MNVAFVVHDFDATFGQGRYGVEILRRLSQRAKFTVFANTCRTNELPAGVPWVRIPSWRARSLTTVFSFLPVAEWMVRRHRPDLIHAQGLSSWSADVITGHMCNGARLRHTPPEDTKGRRFMSWVVPLERAFYQQKRARHLIAISRVLGREIVEEYQWRRPMTVIHHGTNLEQFRPCKDDVEKESARKRYELSKNHWNWLFMGEAVKGLSRVIAALPIFPTARLLVISRSDFAVYRAQASSLGVMERVQFWGFESQPELAFRAADVFVYPNDYDPFGLVGTEAMASGLPVVLGRHIGVAELVEDGKNGLLCDPANPVSLIAALSRLKNTPATAMLLGKAARMTSEQHGWDSCAEATWRVYEQAFRERQEARR